MINSVNGLEFLKPKLINMDKFNSTTTTKLLPPSSLSQTRTFVTISGHHHHQHHRYSNAPSDLHPENQHQEQKFFFNDGINQQERVKVQHLENHTKLQNNKCLNSFHNLYNTSASAGVKDKEEIKDDNEIDVVNVEHLTSSKITTPINIQNTKSAFNLDLNNKKFLNNNDSICGNNNYYTPRIQNVKQDSSRVIETNNNINKYQFHCKQYNNYGLINNNNNNNKQSPTTITLASLSSLSTILEPPASNSITQRTEDQNNAYRHIESVHNYAKSKSFEDDDDNQSPNGSRQSSYLDDDDEEDDDEDEDDDDDYNNNLDVDYDNDDIDYEERLESNANVLDVDYEDLFNIRRHRRLQKLSTSSDGALLIKTNIINCNNKGNIVELKKPVAQFVNVVKDHKMQNPKNNSSNDSNEDEEDIQVDIDVETVESQYSPTIPVMDINSATSFNINDGGDGSAVGVKPDHHARRPMNAFLIFCKRHRAIVKERYKNLENRAITKILGDWWASLDTNDKKCFTNLAQQNKDAFFSANPNFKWYKLPAPPLRTLTTRPTNAFGQEYQDDNDTNVPEIISNNTRSSNQHSNYFKLADEAQMGDLSQLLQVKSKTTKQSADLQQALGETSQFMSAHITGNAEAIVEENPLKRRYPHNENSFSSNSSEDDLLEPKKKNARSCKGKRYQELINSGQIATAVKKSKSSTRLASAGDNIDLNSKQHSFSNVNNKLNCNNSICQKRSISECENLMSCDLSAFDLEQRIKQLPALNLDDYLQRKRNTKKKKKFSSNGKKRGQRSSNHVNNNHSNNNNNNEDNKTLQQLNCSLPNKQQQIPSATATATAAAAVGSQKRKARKESITRRDVSVIEQEVASLLPLTINGCCYFQEAPQPIKFIKDTETFVTTQQQQSLNNNNINVISTSPIIPLQQQQQQQQQQQNTFTTTTSSVSIDISSNVNNNICNNNNNNNSNTLNDNISSPTSDLLILAEVAANRTELKH